MYASAEEVCSMWDKNILKKQKKKVSKLGSYRLPPHLARNHREISTHDFDKLWESIERHYYTGWRSEQNYSAEMFEKEKNDNLFVRLEIDRFKIVPWLDDARRVKDATILEIGCGTGAATVALAEQCAHVVGLDIDDGALAAARDRCRIYGVSAEFRNLNATEMAGVFKDIRFDFIIFFASLEHMKIAERIHAIKNAWDMLPEGALLVIVETPNRLWYFDGHTAMLPFFHWLPDELAFRYSLFSERENYSELYRDYDDEQSREHFLRQGRGVSYHEFELAIRPANELKVVSSLYSFEKRHYKMRHSRTGEQFKALLHSIKSDIHDGFFDKSLDLIIAKT